MDEAPQTNSPKGDQIEAQEQTPPRRRSARLSDRFVDGAASSRSSSSMTETRRNPKRKASEAAIHVSNLPENLLDEALSPLSAKDIEEWEGWIELESEPVSISH